MCGGLFKVASLWPPVDASELLAAQVPDESHSACVAFVRSARPSHVPAGGAAVVVAAAVCCRTN